MMRSAEAIDADLRVAGVSTLLDRLQAEVVKRREQGCPPLTSGELDVLARGILCRLDALELARVPRP